MPTDVSDLVDALAAALDRQQLVTDPARRAAYRGNAWGPPIARIPLPHPLAPPAVVVLPRRTTDVVATVRIAAERGVPVVPYGAGTGVHAGATPLEGSIVLDLGAMREIIRISAADRTARVQPGVVLGDLDAAAARHGLMVGHDPWSQPIASVGGAISTNGVGYLAGKYGGMGDQVVALEVVLATGEVIQTPLVPKASAGPMLRHLFIGAEGVLGIITQADVRLFPRPERRDLVGYRFPSFEPGLEAVLEMLSIQLRPVMIDFEEDEPGPGLLSLGELPDRPSLMYLALEGFREDVEAQVQRVAAICQARGAEAMQAGQAQAFWDVRHEPAERYLRQRAEDPEALAHTQRRRTSGYVNVALPVSAIQPYRRRAAEELAPYRLALKESGIWGMPELFSVRFEHQAPSDPRVADEVEAGTDLGLRIAQELGGSMEYCHGVGLRLAHLMGGEPGMAQELLRRVKRALDPQGLLNPGKLGL